MIYYFNKMSPIKFKFPQNQELPWTLEYWDNNFEKARLLEQKSKVNAHDWESNRKVAPEDIACQVCKTQFSSIQDFVEHVERDREHFNQCDRYLLKEFV